jgi:hypothetical protein
MVMSNVINKSSLRTLRILVRNVKQDIPSFIPNSREELTQVLPRKKLSPAKRRKLIWPSRASCAGPPYASGMRECKSGAISKTDSRWED